MHRVVPELIVENFRVGRHNGEFGAVSMFLDLSGFSTMTDALLRLASEPRWRQTLVQRGLSRSQHFSWHRTAQETLSVYQATCSVPATARAELTDCAIL